MTITSRPAELVGRASERAVLARLLRGVAGGPGAMVLVEGEAGIGKSRLVRALAADAARDGVPVLAGAARPFEATRPFGAVCEALDLRRGSADPRRAAIASMLAERGGAGPDLRFRVVAEVVDLLERLSAQVPAVLVLEDLHWADESTVLTARSVLEGLAHLPVLLVGTLRPSPRPAELDMLVEAAYGAGATVLRLGPLPAAEVAELVRIQTGAAPTARISELVARAGGNPLWVVEILRAVAASPAGDGALPGSFRQLVQRRLRHLPDATLEALRLAAVLGDTFSLVDLATVSGRRAVDLVAALDPAVRAELLGEDGSHLRFRHQLVHDAIYADIPAAARTALHREAADVLAAAGAPLAQVATHVLRGALPGDERAVARLRAAAGDALGRGPDVAVAILEQAAGLLPPGHPQADLLAAELAEALLRAGRVAACAEHAESALAHPHAAEADAPLRLTLVSALSVQNRARELIVHADAALAAVRAPAERALVLAQASYGCTLSGDLAGGEAAARAAVAEAEAAGDVEMTVWGLTTLSFAVKTRGRYGEALAGAARAVDLATAAEGPAARLRHPHFFLGMAATDADRVEQARQAYRSAVRECAELGSSWILPDIQQLSGELHFLVGEWDDAAAELEAGVAAAAARGNRVAVAQSLGYRAVLHLAAGDAAGARAVLAPLEDALRADDPPYGWAVAAYAAALLAESEGRPEVAYSGLLRSWRLAADRGELRHHRTLGPALVRIAVGLGERPAAADVAAGVARAAALAPEVPGLGAAAVRCRGLLEDDPGGLLAAVGSLAGGPRVLERAGAAEEAAAALARAGSEAQARDLLLAAHELYGRLPALAWATRTRSALRQLGVRTGVRGPRRRPESGWAALTTTERAVAELVADGLTNRQIAERLFVSPHTVHSHVRHVCTKLGVSSKAGVAAAAAGLRRTGR